MAKTRKPSADTLVVAVSGTSGAGKSTLIDGAVGHLPSVARLHFDDYIVLGNDIADILGWLDGGADPNVFETPVLAADLRRLISQEPITLPKGGQLVHPAGVIILEEPFGRARDEIAPLIDLSVHLELPHDLAIVRRVLRAFNELPEDPELDHHEDLVSDLEAQLQAYLAAGRGAYQAAESSARNVADLVLDARLPVDELVQQMVAKIETRK